MRTGTAKFRKNLPGSAESTLRLRSHSLYSLSACPCEAFPDRRCLGHANSDCAAQQTTRLCPSGLSGRSAALATWIQSRYFPFLLLDSPRYIIYNSICIQVCMYIYIYTYIHNWLYIYICIYIYIHYIYYTYYIYICMIV